MAPRAWTLTGVELSLEWSASTLWSPQRWFTGDWPSRSFRKLGLTRAPTQLRAPPSAPVVIPDLEVDAL